MKNEKNTEQSRYSHKRIQTAWIPLQAGCLTFVLATVAILVGLWLDARLGSAPRWTLILLLGSAPFSLGGVYFFVQHSLRRMRAEMGPAEPEDES